MNKLLKWIAQYRTDFKNLAMLKRCIRKSEYHIARARRCGEKKVEQMYSEMHTIVVNDYEELKIKMFGALSFMF